jgi:hypothetical protein
VSGEIIKIIKKAIKERKQVSLQSPKFKKPQRLAKKTCLLKRE